MEMTNNLCDSCTNSGCEFQSGIVRTKCAFYMPQHTDDSVKQKLLDSLAEEPTMVISTAYAYAKNYVNYGVDITKAWTTAVQQASILERVRQEAEVEAYDSFKKEYENRLKADMVSMLTEIQLDIKKAEDCGRAFYLGLNMASDIITKKINLLKEQEDGKIIDDENKMELIKSAKDISYIGKSFCDGFKEGLKGAGR